MMKSELENVMHADIVTSRWALSAGFDGWKTTSWMLFGMRVMTNNSELIEELKFLEAIADERRLG